MLSPFSKVCASMLDRLLSHIVIVIISASINFFIRGGEPIQISTYQKCLSIDDAHFPNWSCAILNILLVDIEDIDPDM